MKIGTVVPIEYAPEWAMYSQRTDRLRDHYGQVTRVTLDGKPTVFSASSQASVVITVDRTDKVTDDGAHMIVGPYTLTLATEASDIRLRTVDDLVEFTERLASAAREVRDFLTEESATITTTDPEDHH